MNQSNKGFSLVELIVVIAIMAILVGVAVPTYTAYISKANAGVEADTVGQIVYAAKLANIEYGTNATMSITDKSSVVISFSSTDNDDTKVEKSMAQVMAVMSDVDSNVLKSDSNANTITYTIKYLTNDDVSSIDTSF